MIKGGSPSEATEPGAVEIGWHEWGWRVAASLDLETRKPRNRNRLRGLVFSPWSQRGSNPRPPACKAG